VKDIDIEKEETIASAQRKLSRLSEITDRWILTFANPDILEAKKTEIETQIKK
jgi:hypothetical protein